MSLSILFQRARGWLKWLVLPQPRWVVLGVVALVVAVEMCLTASPWAAAFAVAYQVAGAVLAVAQFVSLQQGLNPGWLLRELREWWAARPIRRTYRVDARQAGSWSIGSPVRLSVWPGAGTPHEEQLKLIWDKLKTMTTEIDEMGQDLKRQESQLIQRLERYHSAAIAAAEAAKESLSSALTSAPLMAVTGFWLILLGLGMQVWLAVVAMP